MLLNDNIKICIVSFQMPTASHLFKSIIFLYREKILSFYRLLNIPQGIFRKTFAAVTWIAVYTYIIFLLLLKQVQYCTEVSALDCQTKNITIKLYSQSLALFSFLNFSATFMAFSREVPLISQVIFLKILGRLLINSRNITGKNWAH